MIYEYKFLISLLFTICIETIVLFIVVRKFFRIDENKIRNSLLLFSGIFASFATLPYLRFILPILLHKYILLNIIGETIVVCLEAIIYYFVLKLSAKQAILLSFICNLFSYVLGLLFVVRIVRF